MAEVKLSQLAMATEWEILLYGDEEWYLRSAAEEAFREIRDLEAQLSFFLPDSDTSLLNQKAAHEPVTVEPRLFRLLQHAASLSEISTGAFDITVAPLIKCWGFSAGSGAFPTPETIKAALASVGMRHVVLHADNSTVQFDTEGVLLDFGAIGKGYAIERAVQILLDLEIKSALIHGGTSSLYAIGAPLEAKADTEAEAEADAWKIAIQRPYAPADSTDYLTHVLLRNQALSVSAPHGKWFESEGKRYGHVIDPRTGYPTSRSLLAALVIDSATESDALSTALLTLGSSWLPTLQTLRPNASALVLEQRDLEQSAGESLIHKFGTAWQTPET